MIELALENLKANKGRLVATVVAIIAGVGFLSAGLMFTDAVRSNLRRRRVQGTRSASGFPRSRCRSWRA